MVRLHRCNHAERGEAVEIFRRDVLRVLDAKPSIALAVGAGDIREEIQNLRNSGVANRVNAQLQASRIGTHEPAAHLLDRLHFV